MADLVFNDYTQQVLADINEKAVQFITEGCAEIQSETQRTTPPTETQLKGSWDTSIDKTALIGKIGSPLESSLWNEFGTGSYAENGDGRKGWWVYVEGNSKSTRVSKTYASEAEANQTVAMLRARGFQAFASNGKPKQKTFRNAYSKKKNALITRAKAIFKGGGGND